MLRVDRAKVSYGGITALQEVSLDVDTGETVILIGSNGAGKSSLIKAIIGLSPLEVGRIHLEGQDISGISCEKRAALGIGYSPEGRRLFSTMSVEDNVYCGMQGLRRPAQKKRFEELSELFPLLRERASQGAGLLSGGQQQIVAVARAMAARPKLLLLDEPFLGLAPIWIEQISAAVREIQKSGATILMAEQMARPALRLAHKGYIIRGGRIRKGGPIDQIRETALAEEYL